MFFNVFHWCAVSLPGIAKNTNGIQNTPQGDVRMYQIVLLFLYKAVQETHTPHSKQHFSIHTALQLQHKNTHQRVSVRCMTIIRCFNVLSLLQESHQTHLLNKKTPEGGVKILQGYCVFLLGKARNTHDIQNTPEGVVRMFFTGLQFLFRALQRTQTAFKTHHRVM